MLEFFRKYQRYFFIIIAVVIVISFSFFGTHQAMTSPGEIQDYIIGSAIDGSEVRKKEIDEIYRFLWSDRIDTQLIEKRIMPNYFNNGVIRKDFLFSGIGVMLVEHYFEEVYDHFKNRVDRHKQFRPYRHPTAPFISVEMLWEQVLPAQKMNLDKFLHEDLPYNSELFSLLVDLYLGEAAFPPNILREYLMLQQKQYDWVQPDIALPRTNLNLFQCFSIEDWFGQKFLQLVSQFVHNAAILAKQKGYYVSKEEARVDLFRNGYEALQVQKQSQDIDQNELASLWKQQLSHLGMDEKAAITVWQKVMLMRRLFEDHGQAVLLDSHQHQMFHSYASKTALVDHYQLPSTLQLQSFDKLLNLVYYCDAVSAQKRKQGELPEKFATIALVKEKHPELVQQRFLVEVAEVKKEDIAQNVSLKEMWEWQLTPDNFANLQKEFPELSMSKATDAEGFFAALERLTPSIHQKLDHFSRMQILDNHPNWIMSALDEKPLVKKEISIAPNGMQTALLGLENARDLMKLLQKAALKETIESDQDALQARTDLELFTENRETYYRFHVLDKDKQMHILTFAEANEYGLLESLVDSYLEEQYRKIRIETPSLFQDESGDWKPFKAVKYQVGGIVYSHVLDAIDRETTHLEKKREKNCSEDLDHFYPIHYLYHYMQSAQLDIRAKGSDSSYLMQVTPVEEIGKLSLRQDLKDQWKVVKETKSYRNYEKSPWFDESLFAMVEKGWSAIQVSQDGKLGFFQLQEKQVSEEDYLQEMKKVQKVLSIEAQRFLMKEILEQLKKQEAIHFSFMQNVE